MGFITPSRRFKPRGALKRAPPVGRPTQRLAGTNPKTGRDLNGCVSEVSWQRKPTTCPRSLVRWWCAVGLVVLRSCCSLRCQPRVRVCTQHCPEHWRVRAPWSSSASIWTLSSCLQVALFVHRGGVDNGRVFTGTPAWQVAGWSWPLAPTRAAFFLWLRWVECLPSSSATPASVHCKSWFGGLGTDDHRGWARRAAWVVGRPRFPVLRRSTSSPSTSPASPGHAAPWHVQPRASSTFELDTGGGNSSAYEGRVMLRLELLAFLNVLSANPAWSLYGTPLRYPSQARVRNGWRGCSPCPGAKSLSAASRVNYLEAAVQGSGIEATFGFDTTGCNLMVCEGSFDVTFGANTFRGWTC